MDIYSQFYSTRYVIYLYASVIYTQESSTLMHTEHHLYLGWSFRCLVLFGLEILLENFKGDLSWFLCFVDIINIQSESTFLAEAGRSKCQIERKWRVCHSGRRLATARSPSMTGQLGEGWLMSATRDEWLKWVRYSSQRWIWICCTRQ